MRSKLVSFSVSLFFSAFMSAACSGSEQAPVGSESTPLETVDQQLLAVAGERLGLSVAIDGDVAVVGAPFSNAAGLLHTGAAFVFEREGTAWVERTKLFASDAIQDGFYGLSVAVSGDVIVVGSPRAPDAEMNQVGAAYVYVREGDAWVERAKLLASDGGLLKSFGYSVDIEGDTIVVGSRWADFAGRTNAGAAYVYVRGEGTTWSEQAKLTASDANNYDTFGFSVSISGETVAVGAYLADLPGRGDAGAVYVYTRSGTVWTQETKLTAADGSATDMLGYSVSIDGDTVLAGAPGRDREGAAESGIARVFTRSGTTWTEGTPLAASIGATGEKFGEAVALLGGTALVGAPYTDVDGLADAGVAYLFVLRDGAWVEDTTVEATEGVARRALGSTVALSGRDAIAGAPGPGTGDGYAYVFRIVLEQGDACTAAGDCLTGHCIDGVCCDNACGDGATNDCMACSIAAGGTQDGVCGPAPGVECRASTNACDVAETCSAESTVCPDDAPPAAGCCTMDTMCNDENVCTLDACNLTSNTCGTTSIEGCCLEDAECDDGNVCTADTCNTDTNACATAVVEGCCLEDSECDDGNVCTADTCNGDTNVCAVTAIEGCCLEASDCDDSDVCTDDACVDNECVYDVAPACVDAGTPDAGAPDAGGSDGGTEQDASAPDAGAVDSGAEPPPPSDDGCSCVAAGARQGTKTSGSAAFAMMVAALWLGRRVRRTSKRPRRARK